MNMFIVHYIFTMCMYCIITCTCMSVYMYVYHVCCGCWQLAQHTNVQYTCTVYSVCVHVCNHIIFLVAFRLIIGVCVHLFSYNNSV